jgi:hypothetical protein
MVLDPLSKLGVVAGTGKAGLFLPLQFLVFPGFPSISDLGSGKSGSRVLPFFSKNTPASDHQHVLCPAYSLYSSLRTNLGSRID